MGEIYRPSASYWRSVNAAERQLRKYTQPEDFIGLGTWIAANYEGSWEVEDQKKSSWSSTQAFGGRLVLSTLLTTDVLEARTDEGQMVFTPRFRVIKYATPDVVPRAPKISVLRLDPMEAKIVNEIADGLRDSSETPTLPVHHYVRPIEEDYDWLLAELEQGEQLLLQQAERLRDQE